MKVHGLLLLDKPAGLSSNAALQRARRLLDADKAGHGGTLDPLASGLLPVLLGEACKLAAAALEGDKGYRARVRLGECTTTDDREGETIERRPTVGILARPAEIEAALDGFRGPIDQVPPVFSAIKRDGKPMYRRARAGEAVDLPPRPVVIHSLVLEAIEGEDLLLSVLCSKGTYIRSLARDLGEALGCGAHLAGLERTRVGSFSIDQATALAELEALEPAQRAGRLIGLETLVADWPRYELEAAPAAAFRQGQAIRFEDGLARESLPAPPADDRHAPGPAQDGPVAVFSDGRLIGLGRRHRPPDGPTTSRAELLAPSRVIV